MHCDVAQPILPLTGIVICMGLAYAASSMINEKRLSIRSAAAIAVALLGAGVLSAEAPAGCGTTEPADARRVDAYGEPAVTPVRRTVRVEANRNSDGSTTVRAASRGWPASALVSFVLCQDFDIPRKGSEFYDLTRDRCLGPLLQGVVDEHGSIEEETRTAVPPEVVTACEVPGNCVVLATDLESLQVSSTPFIIDSP